MNERGAKMTADSALSLFRRADGYLGEKLRNQSDCDCGACTLCAYRYLERGVAKGVRLEIAIKDHRAQKADDRCVEDDDALYEALGDGIKCDRKVGDKYMMLANCARFIDRRCEGGGWTSYMELEKELNDAHALLDEQGVVSRRYTREYGKSRLLVPETRPLSERIRLLIQTITGLSGE